MKKVIALLLSVIMIMSFITIPALAEKPITVLLNGEKMEFDVPPVLMNSRTMVPMRAIFEALGAEIYWNDSNEAVTAISSTGKTVVIAIGSCEAIVGGELKEIDAPPVLHNDRTLVPLRFVSETFGCQVGWDDATYTVTITGDAKGDVASEIHFIDAQSFDVQGCWIPEGATQLKGKTDTSQKAPYNPDEDAIANLKIRNSGKFKVWANSRDFATNQQGSRYFNIAIDGERAPLTLGQHGKDGYHWQEVGVYEFEAGMHEFRLQDTSGFFARSGGIIVSGDMDFVPAQDGSNYTNYSVAQDKFNKSYPAVYPKWAVGGADVISTETIENDKIKIVFHQGNTYRGSVVQNEVFYKRADGSYVPVKELSEELGVLAMCADSTTLSDKRPAVAVLSEHPFAFYGPNTYDIFGEKISVGNVQNYYQTGKPEWLIPTSMQKIDEKTIALKCSSESVEGTLTFTFDDLSYEPKVTFNATPKKAGAYSFIFFNGDDFKEDEFDRVTAPLMYVEDTVPLNATVLEEYMMFTPMCTFTFDEVTNPITKGIVVDPSYVRQRVATPGDCDFGIMFRSPTGDVRGQIIAPLFGTEKSIFDAGEEYSFAYRLIYNDSDWFENFKHVAEDMYNCVDLRSNYYASLNEAIYNTTDLIMDDTYGGWDDKDMAFYNMEAKMVTTQSNIVEIMQRYMLTENEEILDERAIPSIAFALSRGGTHFKRIEGNNSYTPVTPTPLGDITAFAPASFVGLYEMSQGRTPFLFNHAISKSPTINLDGTIYNQALKDMIGGNGFDENIKKAADAFLEKFNEPGYEANGGGFIYSNSVPLLNTFVRAYEETGDKKYLDAAEEVGKCICTEVWTTGYHNDFATTDYTVDPVETSKRPVANEIADWFYHKGGVQWRIGNPVGVNATILNSESKLKEETAPGWVPARAGLGTEHAMTPSNANAITMNMWAGTMLRLAKYTGEEYFETTARNAMIGRFANYAGYYNERYLLHDKQANYPYDGPDFNLIYWHHIPVFLGLLEDFLINDIWYKSDANIEFPSVVNSGYAYFLTNQYGFAPGKFYDEDGMWLWLDRGIIDPGTKEVNYLTARKDGVLGISMVNELDEEITTTVTLGEKVPNASSVNGIATVYDKAGNKSQIEVKDGKFEITIPAREIKSVVLKADVKVPSFVKEYTPSNDLGDTVKAFKEGKAYLLQFNDDNYYVYMYSSVKDAKSATFTYTHNGKTESKTINEYPFETIVKVPATSNFTFNVTIDGADYGGATLKPADVNELKPYKVGDTTNEVDFYTTLADFEAFAPTVTTIGCGTGTIRVVVKTNSIPFENLANDYLKGAKFKGVFVSKADGSQTLVECRVTGNEVRSDGTTVIIIERGSMGTVDGSLYYNPKCLVLSPNANFDDYKIEVESTPVTPTPQEPATPSVSTEDFDPFALKYSVQGTGGVNFRFVMSKKDIPFAPGSANTMGLKISGKLIDEALNKEFEFSSQVIGYEDRGDTCVLVAAPTEEITTRKYPSTNEIKTYKWDLKVYPANAEIK